MKKSTSERLKTIMSDRNLKQVDILNMSKPYQKELNIKMSKSHLSQYVNGKSSPDQHKLYLLSKTLSVSEAWLMGYDVEQQRISDNDRKESNNITHIYNELEPSRQKYVYNVAKEQLEEQNKVNIVELPKEEKKDDQNMVIAAHIDDDATEEDMDEIRNYIESLKKGKK